jgi:hypothetical protein
MTDNKKVKVKVKQSRYRPEQAQRVHRGIALRDLGAGGGGGERCGQQHVPAALPPRKTR